MLYVEIPVTDGAKQNNLHALSLLPCRAARVTSLQISNEFNISFLALQDSEGSQIL